MQTSTPEPLEKAQPISAEETLKQSLSLLNFQYTATQVLAEAASLQEATPKLLQALCESLDWDVGEFWAVDIHANELCYAANWHSPDLDLTEFEAISQETTFAPGVGLTGQAWLKGKPVWMDDVSSNAVFSRAATASKIHLHSALAFPIIRHQQTIGVITLFSQQQRQWNEHLMLLMAAVGSQIGQFIERKEAELALQQLNKELETRVEERTAALRESEARLRALVDNLPFGFWASDTESRYIMQNAESIKQWGNLIGKHPQELDLPPVVLQTWLDNNNRVLNGEVLRFENRYEKDGKSWLCSTTLAPVWDGTEVRGLLGVDIDITEQKLAEEAVRENEERLRLVLESIPVMMDAFDDKGHIIMWNSECERVTGFSAAEIIHNPRALEMLYPDPDYRTRMMAEWSRLGNNFRNWEWEIGCKDGSTKTVLWSNLSESFPIPGWASWGIGIDISDRKRIENERRQAEEALRESEQQLRQKAQELEQTLIKLQRTQAQVVQSEKMSSLGQLVAGVAHEINNPVNFIYGNLNHASEYTQDLIHLIQLYQQHYPNPAPDVQAAAASIDLEFLMEDLPKLLSSMRVGADRIQKIVRSLRNFSRMDEAELKTVDIHEGIDSTLMILQNRLKSKGSHPGIEVVKEYGNLPLVECYPGQLNQVFMNILSNAIDALEENFELRTQSFELQTSASTHLPTITIRTEKLGSNRIQIAIADNGPGMTENQRQRLFDPFFTTKPVGKGTGLGLSISYQVVTEKHRGELTCISAPGQGAEFLINIPVCQSHE
ncbi:MAG: PAS domain S-box protein [Leptolyngbyaceae cyanobacterium HOT.MB2.61]|nr:PAS domain S-box protein [Leptolyngbyaceae cyanobacterium HOT.MB2.61]